MQTEARLTRSRAKQLDTPLTAPLPYTASKARRGAISKEAYLPRAVLFDVTNEASQDATDNKEISNQDGLDTAPESPKGKPSPVTTPSQPADESSDPTAAAKSASQVDRPQLQTPTQAQPRHTELTFRDLPTPPCDSPVHKPSPAEKPTQVPPQTLYTPTLPTSSPALALVKSMDKNLEKPGDEDLGTKASGTMTPPPAAWAFSQPAPEQAERFKDTKHLLPLESLDKQQQQQPAETPRPQAFFAPPATTYQTEHLDWTMRKPLKPFLTPAVKESQPIEESPRVTEEGLGESAGPLQAQLASKAVPHITEEEHSIIVEECQPMEEGLGGSMEIPLLSAREPVIPASKAEHNVVEQEHQAMEEGLGESSGTPQLLSVSKDETPGQKADEISVVEVEMMESPEDMAEASYLGSSAVKARPLAEEAEASDPKGDQATTAAVPEPEVAPKGEERVVTQTSEQSKPKSNPSSKPSKKKQAALAKLDAAYQQDMQDRWPMDGANASAALSSQVASDGATRLPSRVVKPEDFDPRSLRELRKAVKAKLKTGERSQAQPAPQEPADSDCTIVRHPNAQEDDAVSKLTSAIQGMGINDPNVSPEPLKGLPVRQGTHIRFTDDDEVVAVEDRLKLRGVPQATGQHIRFD